ncbi:MAG: outer membrane lipoprotein-sorting protein, partial [Bacteroidales bacterium]|nr:outer membrane lipoprotein-sorting protein [Bacteroidales bacterium]
MKKIITIFISAYSLLSASAQNADEILSRVEKNMSSDNRIFESSMIIHGIRNDRTIT